ncbi:MAG TPA: tail fiber domain-containing protein [bacterium]|nr:tail fiber domain-containing protein [bacterium]
MRFTIRLTPIALLLLPLLAHAAVPASITVQGKLTDLSGSPLPAGSKNFTFKVFDAPTLGNEIWPNGAGENQTLTSDAAGLWIGLLGAAVPLTDAVFSDTVRWLEITVDGTTLPRVRLVTGPYAHRVSTVDGATGGTITTQLAIGPGHTNTGQQGFCAGADNFARGAYSSATGGKDNIAFSDSAHVGGGGGNTAYGLRATVGGGANNETGSDRATVAGGRGNKALGLSSTVGGGYSNIASGTDATVGGGTLDSASGPGATVAGGNSNKATGPFNTIGGGALNRTSGASVTIAGGFQNLATSDDATIGGGYDNQATGYRSTIPGGTANIAGGANSFACGVNAWASGDQSFVWNDDPVGALQSLAPRHFIVGCQGRIGLGTNSPEGYLHVFDGSAGAVTASPNSISVFERDSVGYLSILTPPNTEQGILFGHPGSVADGGLIYASGSVRALQFRTTGNATRMTLDHDPIGIGSRLSLTGPAGTVSTLVFKHATGTDMAAIDFDEPSFPDQLLIAVLGAVKLKVAVGQVSVLTNLDVTGNVCANNIACPSDARLKRDIRPLHGALNSLKHLDAVRYRWREDVVEARHWSDGEQIGLLAQQVQDVAPQAVVEMSDGHLAVDYARLVPLLIEGMKEQQRQIEELKARLDNREK